MSDSFGQDGRLTQSAKDDDPAGRFTRRAVLAGAAAATAAVTVRTIDTPAYAQSVDSNSPPDMVAFVLLSAALTGIAEPKLAPGFTSLPAAQPGAPPLPIDIEKSIPGSDPVDIKRDYFNWVNERHPAAFETLLRIAKDNANGLPNRAQAIIDKVQFTDDSTKTASEVDAKYLARSIVLMWYLGAWYDPDTLRTPNASALTYKVISPKAYTQAWALRVARAHPMGFSEMQFGYWNREPNPLPDFIGRSV
jgi:hypothetical protein